MLQEDLGDALALVNQARMAFGKDVLTELPDATPGKSMDCLFYRALSDIGCHGVSGEGGISFEDERQANYIGALWGARVHGKVVKAPSQFGRVIGEFDGHNTHYESGGRKPHF
jgi:hypothetical protein